MWLIDRAPGFTTSLDICRAKDPADIREPNRSRVVLVLERVSEPHRSEDTSHEETLEESRQVEAAEAGRAVCAEASWRNSTTCCRWSDERRLRRERAEQGEQDEQDEQASQLEGPARDSARDPRCGTCRRADPARAAVAADPEDLPRARASFPQRQVEGR